jgi:hypothetical protein
MTSSKPLPFKHVENECIFGNNCRTADAEQKEIFQKNREMEVGTGPLVLSTQPLAGSPPKTLLLVNPHQSEQLIFADHRHT